MEIRMEEKKSEYLYRILCVLAAVVTSLPVACNYIMDGGVITEWIARMDELVLGLYGGQVYLFPSAEVFAQTGIRVNAMNSNLWFLFPGLLYRLSGDIVLVYRLCMLTIQVGTLLTAILFFERIFAEEKTKFTAFFGVLLYMTCPYRIYVCYDSANLFQAVVWMLLPLYTWEIVGMIQSKRSAKDMAIAALVLAGIGYADVVSFLIVLAVTLLVAVIFKKVWIFVPMIAGSAVFLPGLYRLLQYLFLDHFQDFGMPVQSIMENGYRFGEYFSTYAYKEGRPGMGLGMMLCLLAGLWMNFVYGNQEKSSICRFFAMLSVVFWACSFYYFPWDIFQRFGGWSLKLVSLFDTPAIFAGWAFAGLSVPGAWGVKRISKHENKWIAFAVPVMVLLFCFGVAVYLCSMLIDNRIPLSVAG